MYVREKQNESIKLENAIAKLKCPILLIEWSEQELFHFA